MRKKRRNNPVNKKQIIISLVICLAVALFAAVFIHMEQTKHKSMQITAGNTHNVGNSYRNIVYKGQEYHATLTMPEGALQAGNNYTYTVKVRNKVLEVSEATIAKWNDIDGGEVNAGL